MIYKQLFIGMHFAYDTTSIFIGDFSFLGELNDATVIIFTSGIG